MFKVGDKVKCIRTKSAYYSERLELNKIYTVSNYIDSKYTVDGVDRVTLKETKDEIYYAERFELDIKTHRKQKLEKIKNGYNN